MELKPGNKQTEVGVIPEDWEVRTLQDLCKEEITYGIVQCGPHVSGGIPYIRVSDMDGPILDKEKMLPIDSKFSLENYNKIIEEKNPVEKEKLEKNV
jgi:type I restriction enzyme S subunit